MTTQNLRKSQHYGQAGQQQQPTNENEEVESEFQNVGDTGSGVSEGGASAATGSTGSQRFPYGATQEDAAGVVTGTPGEVKGGDSSSSGVGRKKAGDVATTDSQSDSSGIGGSR